MKKNVNHRCSQLANLIDDLIIDWHKEYLDHAKIPELRLYNGLSRAVGQGHIIVV